MYSKRLLLYMEQQFTYLDIPVDVNLDLICNYHDASSVYLDTSHIVEDERIVKRVVRIAIRHDIPSESGDFYIHPSYDLDAILEKQLPEFKYKDQLLGLASNMIELDWGLVYGQYLVSNGAHSISLFKEANFALNELRSLMSLRNEENRSSITFNTHKKIDERNGRQDKGPKVGRGLNKFIIDKTKQVTLNSKDEVDFILGHIIDYKLKVLTIQPVLQDIILEQEVISGNKIVKFDLEDIDFLIMATSVSFNEARAFFLFRKQFATILYKFIDDLAPKNTKGKNKFLLLYSTLLLFNMIEQDLCNEHDTDRKKEKYIDTLLRRHSELLTYIKHLGNEIKKKVSNENDIEKIQELQEKMKRLREGLYPLIGKNNFKVKL